ncbi:hypothetical protein [Tuwongella immobilis]|uniref:Uncharacterized protein n=1 Tax=Tuwongella immobilis TaxID=692036 RepID=A0A6C2YIP7_9BACT|nr:hypothetical protein [Tuwongella immobilis]VIP01287.1 unnamed protein product [Tuwongella immobilis]VTR98000.1 unnamed protein product [Tuwongella immobilis]
MPMKKTRLLLGMGCSRFAMCLYWVVGVYDSTRAIQISGEFNFLHFVCVGYEGDGKVRPVCLYRTGLFGWYEPVPTGYGPHDAAYIPEMKTILYRIHRSETPNCVIVMLPDRSLVLIPIDFVRKTSTFTEYRALPSEKRPIVLEDILHDETNGFQIDFLINERIRGLHGD